MGDEGCGPVFGREWGGVAADGEFASLLVDDPVGEDDFGLDGEQGDEVKAVGEEGLGGAADGTAAGEGAGELGDCVDAEVGGGGGCCRRRR